MKKICGIYKITSPSKKVYVGQAIDICKRFNDYDKMRCKGQPIIYNSLKKYGPEKHKFEILCECSIEELNEKERYYQDLYSCIGKNGLNLKLTKAKDRSGKHSEMSDKLTKTIRNRISKKQRLECFRANLGDFLKGKNKFDYSQCRVSGTQE